MTPFLVAPGGAMATRRQRARGARPEATRPNWRSPLNPRLPRVIGAVLLAVGCESAAATVDACKVGVDVRVSRGAVPKIHWTPACGVDRLSVETPSTPGEPLWRVGRGRRLIRPPVVYGEVPAGAREEYPARPLGEAFRAGIPVLVIVRDARGVAVGFSAPLRP